MWFAPASWVYTGTGCTRKVRHSGRRQMMLNARLLGNRGVPQTCWWVVDRLEPPPTSAPTSCIASCFDASTIVHNWPPSAVFYVFSVLWLSSMSWLLAPFLIELFHRSLAVGLVPSFFKSSYITPYTLLVNFNAWLTLSHGSDCDLDRPRYWMYPVVRTGQLVTAPILCRRFGTTFHSWWRHHRRWQSFGDVWRLSCLLGQWSPELTSNDLFWFVLDLVFYRHCIRLHLFCKRSRNTLVLTALYKCPFIFVRTAARGRCDLSRRWAAERTYWAIIISAQFESDPFRSDGIGGLRREGGHDLLAGIAVTCYAVTRCTLAVRQVDVTSLWRNKRPGRAAREYCPIRLPQTEERLITERIRNTGSVALWADLIRS